MFKVGEKVICISLGNHFVTEICIGKTYTVIEDNLSLKFKECDKNYNSRCFISLKEYRKLKLKKLKKLCSK